MNKINPNNSNASDGRDADLVDFLRQHAPPVPEATVGEEERLMTAIAAHQHSKVQQQATRRRHFLPKRLGIAMAFSILVYALWQLYQVMMPNHRSVTELAELENFWFQNWDSVANAEDTPPWLSDNDSGSDRPEPPLKPNPFYPSPDRQE